MEAPNWAMIAGKGTPTDACILSMTAAGILYAVIIKMNAPATQPRPFDILGGDRSARAEEGPPTAAAQPRSWASLAAKNVKGGKPSPAQPMIAKGGAPCQPAHASPGLQPGHASPGLQRSYSGGTAAKAGVTLDIMRRALKRHGRSAKRQNSAITAARKLTQEELHLQVNDDPDFDISTVRLVGGVDISFEKGTDKAIGCMVVWDLVENKLVYQDCIECEMTITYQAGFLAFREVPVYEQLVKRIPPEVAPSVILVDGQGTLHHRGFGSACHLGVKCDVVTIGIGKQLLAVDGLDPVIVEKQCDVELQSAGDTLELFDHCGELRAVALRCGDHKGCPPVFVSPGQRMSMETAVALAWRCCTGRSA